MEINNDLDSNIIAYQWFQNDTFPTELQMNSKRAYKKLSDEVGCNYWTLIIDYLVQVGKWFMSGFPSDLQTQVVTKTNICANGLIDCFSPLRNFYQLILTICQICLI